MPFTLRYHPAVREDDLPLIDKKTKERIRKAIEQRLQTEPHKYGEPLPKYGFSASGIGSRYIRTSTQGCKA